MRRESRFKNGLQFFAAALIITLAIFTNSAFSGGESCIHCGMNKAQFGHSWVVIEHDDGTLEGVCSVHCAAIDMALHTDKGIKKITVGDYNTQKQIDVDSAFWVIGGDKMGVMTANAKWAFETKPAADQFMSDHGGRPATFDEVMKTAFEDMYADTLMIQKKRKTMKMKQKE